MEMSGIEERLKEIQKANRIARYSIKSNITLTYSDLTCDAVGFLLTALRAYMQAFSIQGMALTACNRIFPHSQFCEIEDSDDFTNLKGCTCTIKLSADALTESAALLDALKEGS